MLASNDASRKAQAMKVLGVSTLGVAGLIALVLFAVFEPTTTADARTAQTVVDAEGNLRVPADYRTTYQFLGSWAVASGVSKTPDQLHVVYASPGTISAYLHDSHFPDGSVLVKEVYETTTEKMTTGDVSRANTLKGWFVMVKESKDTHPANALWGDGWSWSWFDADNSLKTTSTNYKVECLPCHIPARATDWVYVQGYPPLKSAH